MYYRCRTDAIKKFISVQDPLNTKLDVSAVSETATDACRVNATGFFGYLPRQQQNLAAK